MMTTTIIAILITINIAMMIICMDMTITVAIIHIIRGSQCCHPYDLLWV